MLNLATVFSGIGAPEHALKRLGIQYNIVFACDNGERHLKHKYEDIVEATSSMNNIARNQYIKDLYDKIGENLVEKEYKANHQIEDSRFFQDVKHLDGKEFKEKVDIFIGGSPCQSFSVMGKHGGLEEARGTLFYEYARLVKEIQPKVFIYENVPGMLKHDQGHTWEVISKIFGNLNYLWNYWVLNATDYGLPQNRKRIFVVGFNPKYQKFFKKLKKPEPKELTRSLEDLLETDIPNKYYLPIKGFQRVIDPNEKKHVALNGKIARCQVACQQYNWYGDMRFETEIPKHIENDNRIYKGVFGGKRGVARCLTPRECLRIMGFEDNFKIAVSDQHMYRQAGNSIAVDVIMEVLRQINLTGIFEQK